MRFAVVFSLLSFALACNAAPTETKKTLPMPKGEVLKIEQSRKTGVVKTETKKEEDCDDKAKKTIEIKAETISLTGNTGCSLDEVKP